MKGRVHVDILRRNSIWQLPTTFVPHIYYKYELPIEVNSSRVLAREQQQDLLGRGIKAALFLSLPVATNITIE